MKVVFCSAYRKGDPDKKARHRFYIQALELSGVHCLMGHEVNEPSSCPQCSHAWTTPREKATDINLALSVFQDAVDDIFDVAFIVSADTDQAATLSVVKKRYPHKRLVAVCPPQRTPSKHLMQLADMGMQLTERMLDEAAFPAIVTDGAKCVYRPAEYDPPNGWVHPDNRPKR